MEDNFETQLRQALRAKASGVPEAAVERVRRASYSPRTVSPRLAASAIGGVALGAGATVTAVVLTSATPAFAGWAPAPTSAASAQTSGAATTCEAQLGSLPGGTPAADWSQAATDVRGPYTLFVYEDGSALATCLAGPSLTSTSESLGKGRFTEVGGAVGAPGAHATGTYGGSVGMLSGQGSGDIERYSVQHLDTSSQGPYTVIDGELASDVSSLTLVRSDGVDVQASVNDGWFLAWWPGSADATSAEITTSSGTTSQPLVLAPAAPSAPAATGAAATTTVPAAVTTVAPGTTE